jgi:glycosyltransferase involved in cell wall biosynthesis
MSQLKVSIITVARNSSETIRKTLTSVCDQDYAEIEHIVIDGASQDDTVQIVQQTLRRGGQLVSESDTGLYNAMNKGLRLARGDIIAFLNSDDYYASKTVISDVVRAFLKDDEIDAVFGNVAFFRKRTPLKFSRFYDSGLFKPSRLKHGWMPAHPAMFMHRRVFEHIGGFREDFQIAADFEFVARAFSKMAIRYVHIPRVLTHMMSGGVSTRGLRAKMVINVETVRACRINGIKTNIFNMAMKYPLKLLGYLP